MYEGDPATTAPSAEFNGWDILAEAFAGLGQYMATTHFNGQSRLTLDGDRAAGETYCLAHHLTVHDEGRTLMVMALRYVDVFVRGGEGTWRFEDRALIIDWVDTRASQSSGKPCRPRTERVEREDHVDERPRREVAVIGDVVAYEIRSCKDGAGAAGDADLTCSRARAHVSRPGDVPGQ